MKRLRLLLIPLAIAFCIPLRHLPAQPIQMGDGVATNGAVNAGDPVLALIRAQNANIAPVNVDWQTSLVRHASWTRANLGQIFGVALDKQGNIFVTATACYSTDSWGPGGAGAIYRIDGITGAITTFATLPNNGNVGLGNICYDPDHDPPGSINGQFFVTNMEDGKIYRINGTTGAVIAPAFDPAGWSGFQPDAGANGAAPLGERLWGIAYRKLPTDNGRIYFGRWREDQGNGNANIANEIHSTPLTTTGAFAGGGQLEVTLPALLTNTWSNPPSDIEFSQDKMKMIVAERGMSSFSVPVAHNARILEYTAAPGWVSTGGVFNIGSYLNATNCAGGTDYGYKIFDAAAVKTIDCDVAVWASGDALHFPLSTPPGTWYPGRIHGAQRFPATGGSVMNSVLIDYDHDTITNVPMTWIGDIDIYKDCAAVLAGDCNNLSHSIVRDPTAPTNTCCWDLTITNNDLPNLWTSVRLDVLTPGVTMTNVGAPANWSVTQTASSATYTPAAGFIPMGATAPLKFCLVTGNVAPPQQVQLTWYAENGKICREIISLSCASGTRPDCGNLTGLNAVCTQIANGQPTYSLSFAIRNSSTVAITNATINVASPGNVTISPASLSFPAVAPNFTTGTQNLTLYGGQEGDSVCLEITIRDNTKQNGCTFKVCFALPECKDCCESLGLDFEAITVKPSSNGTITFSSSITATPSLLRSFNATIVNATLREACRPKYKSDPAANIGGIFTGGNFGAVPAIPPPAAWGSSSVTWGTVISGSTVNNAPLTLQMQFPPPPSDWKCHDTISFCIKFTYTDTLCRTCDTTICTTLVRHPVIWHHLPIDKMPFKPGEEDGEDERGKTEERDRSILSGGSPAGDLMKITMATENSGILTITNPSPEEVGADPLSAITILSIQFEPAGGTDLLSIRDLSNDQTAIPVDRVATLDLDSRIHPGTTRLCSLLYNNYVGARAFENYVKMTYIIAGYPDEVNEATVLVLARTPEGMGGDVLELDKDIILANVRTYALKFRNGNHTGDNICRVTVSVPAGGNDDIIAVGPGADQYSVPLKSYKLSDDQFRLMAEEPNGSQAVAEPLPPETVVTPIYVTVGGGPDQEVTFQYITYNERGEEISSGEFKALTPLAPGVAGLGDPSKAAYQVTMVECVPNPLTNQATFHFSLAAFEPAVTLVINDALGNEVARVIDGAMMNSGAHELAFDASKLPAGTYFYTLRTGTFTQTRKLQIVR